MRPFVKLAGTSTFETSNFEMKAKNPDNSDRNGQESFDSLIRKDLPFSRSGDNQSQLIHMLHAFDQPSANKFSKGSAINLGTYSKEEQNGDANTFATESSSVKESIYNSLKETGSFGKGMQNPTEHMSSLKFPEAVVAIAQAAAKVNGEPEKYLPGWPLLSKVQMLKCDKCSREFVSSLNHRRHIRVHRRLLNLEKEDSQKKRVYLAEFWDKLSADDASQILSLKNMMLEEVPGSAIVKEMPSFIRKASLLSLPQFYVKAGVALLDVVQMKYSKFPLPATDLFSILDDACEKTFLCAGTALQVQKFVFAGEAGKVSLEVRNLVASLGFLIEQKLVKAWLVDKDAEALRCQKLLVEEEEAAEKKKAKQLERKRLKKLRHKELKEKDQTVSFEAVDSGPCSPEISGGSLTTGVSSPSSEISEDVSPESTPFASCLDLSKDSYIVEDDGVEPNVAHSSSPDTDLESRASQDSVAGVAVYPELDYANHQELSHDKTFSDDCRREHKNPIVTNAVVTQKHDSGRKNQQTLLKRSRKLYSGLSSRQNSANGVLNSSSVQGQRFGPNCKSPNQRAIWTKKAHQTTIKDADKGLKAEGRPEDGMHASCDVKLGDSLQFSSDICNGLTSEGTSVLAQEGLGKIAESSPNLDPNNIGKDLDSIDGNDPSHCSNPTVTACELLIGSMSLSLESFPNGVAKARYTRSENEFCDEFKCIAERQNCASNTSCHGSCNVCATVSHCTGALHPNNSCVKAEKLCAAASGETDSSGHSNGKDVNGKFVKQGFWQDGINKSGVKIWRPVSFVTYCSSIEGCVTDFSEESTHIEGFPSDSQGRHANNATVPCPLRYEAYVSQNMKNLSSRNGDSQSTEAHNQQNFDTHQSEKEFEEISGRISRSESIVQESEIVETVDQREAKFQSACDAAVTFLSQRWETAAMSREAEILESSDSGTVEGPISGGVASVVSESGYFVAGTVSETNCVPSFSFQSKDSSVSAIEVVQGRQKTFDCGSGTAPGRPLTAHHIQVLELQKTGPGCDSRKLPARKPEKGLKYIPRQRK